MGKFKLTKDRSWSHPGLTAAIDRAWNEQYAGLTKDPNADPYQEILKAAKALQDAEVPTEDRIAYYYVYSWWRHPIKRYKQWKLIRHLDN
jgi:hypothetical protein